MGAPHDRHELDILNELEANAAVSQRSLASRLGIALGLTNLLVRQLVRRGFVRMIHVKPNRVRYLITPAGLAEKTRMTRDYLAHTISFYADARARIAQRFTVLSSTWPSDSHGGKRIAFYGADEIAEIGYVCLQETDLSLVAVIDDRRTKPFFGIDVHTTAGLRLDPTVLDGIERIVVPSFRNQARDAASAQLRDLGINDERLFWL
jgi:DNA-binding Lrp family transcriptional regulator